MQLITNPIILVICFMLITSIFTSNLNECETFGRCSQICIKDNDTYKCECESGYMIDHQNHTRCKAVDGNAILLVSDYETIQNISLDNNHTSSITNNLSKDLIHYPEFDFSVRAGMLFWTKRNEIYKAPINGGGGFSTGIRHKESQIFAIAVDWIYERIYSTGKKTIESAGFKGEMPKTLIDSNLSSVWSIAVDPLRGWMYWSEFSTTIGNRPKIERAGMDGTHREVIVSTEMLWPKSITLDLVAKRLFWVDRLMHRIYSCDFDGGHRRLVLSDKNAVANSLFITTFEDAVYWTDMARSTVTKADKFDGSGVATVRQFNKRSPITVRVYHPYAQPNGTNHCGTVNGNCTRLCIPAPQIVESSPKISCACPDDLTLQSDGLTCVG